MSAAHPISPTNAVLSSKPSAAAYSDGEPKNDLQFTLHVSKLDAGVAILLTQDHYIIEFPSILLPETISAGSVVQISVSRNNAAEKHRMETFLNLQRQILNEFGQKPIAPTIQVKTVSHTVAILELTKWDPKRADIYSVDVYKNNVKETGGSVICKLAQNRIKVTGLTLMQEYQFRIEIQSSAGILVSNVVSCHTRSPEDLSGLVICLAGFPDDSATPETDLTAYSLRRLRNAVERMSAKWTEDVSIDNTHLIYRPDLDANNVVSYAAQKSYDLGVELNLPIVSPDWLYACLDLGKIKSTTEFYARKTSI